MEFFTMIYPDNESIEKALVNLKNLNYEYVEDEGSVYVHDSSFNLIKLDVKNC